MEVNWQKIDMSQKKADLPPPLSYQSGGYFWLCLDAGAHGKRIFPAWWSGEKFVDVNKSIITHFAPMEFPTMPKDST